MTVVRRCSSLVGLSACKPPDTAVHNTGWVACTSAGTTPFVFTFDVPSWWSTGCMSDCNVLWQASAGVHKSTGAAAAVALTHNVQPGSLYPPRCSSIGTPCAAWGLTLTLMQPPQAVFNPSNHNSCGNRQHSLGPV